MLYKDIAPGKLAVLMGLYRGAVERFERAPGDAGKILGDGEATARDGMVRGEASRDGASRDGMARDGTVRDGTVRGEGEVKEAALVVVCNALLNLDEVITKN
jgi:hypothetical protein